MSRVLSRCLAGLLLALLATRYEHALAQQPVGVDIENPAVTSGSPGEAAVHIPQSASIDAFDVELRFDPALVRIDEVAAAEGWQLIPQSVQVDRNGVVRAAGFAVGAACTEGARCDLMVLAFVGRADADAAGLAITRVELASGGTPMAAESLRPGPASDPLDDLPGERPDPDQQAGDDPGGGANRMPVYLAAASAGVVVLAAIIAVVRRRSSTAVASPSDAPEWDGDVDSFLDRVASLGTLSADGEDEEPPPRLS